MNPLSLIPAPYQLLAKGIALLALVIALWAAWHSFTGHYIAIGKAEVQAQWDKQKAADVIATVAAQQAVLAKERQAAIQQATTISALQESYKNEIQARDKTINDLNLGARRMRLISGHNEINHSLPDATPSASVSNETCSVRLPAEIGAIAIRLGSDANDTADQLRACQAIILQDRAICNGR